MGDAGSARASRRASSVLLGRTGGLGSALVVALAAHALVRGLGLAVLAATAPLSERSALQVLTRWDARWYARIADDGYGRVVASADGRTLSDYAFFPLYPALERAASAVTGLTPLHAGLVVSGVSSLAAAAGIFRVGALLHDARSGVILVVLWSALPVSVVQSMAYTESLFTALAAWALHAVLTHRYVAAGALASLAGLTRPMGVAVVAAVMVGATLRLADRRRCRPAGGPPTRPDDLGPASGLLLAPLGLVGYLAHVSRSRDALLGYFEVTSAWGNGFDGGRAFAGWVGGMLLDGRVPLAGMVLLGLALLVVAAGSTVARGYPWPVAAFTLGAVLLSFVTASYFGSKPRYLLPVFTLLLWPSPWLAGLPLARLLPALGALAVMSAVYGAFWLHGPGPP